VTAARSTELVAQFERRFGRSPVGVWQAPGRVNLIGDHTDYNEGFVLPFALDQRAYVAVAPTAGRSRVGSRQRLGEMIEFDAQTVQPGDIAGWGAYVAGVFWAVRVNGGTIANYDVMIDSEVPVGAGLSSSAALECSVAVALNELGPLGRSRTELAQLAQHAENHFVGAPVGLMDHLAALYGQTGHALFIDIQTLAIEPVPLNLGRPGLELLVVDTNTPHALVDGQYAQRRLACTTAAAGLGVSALRDIAIDDLANALPRLPNDEIRARVRHVVSENARVVEVADRLRSEGDPRVIGPVLTASHVSLRDDYEVSVPQLDLAVQTLLSAGAYGARMTGGGFGGSVIALVDAGRTPAVGAAVERAYRDAGYAMPDTRRVTASAGAGRWASP
jgi:galactokinase